MNRFFVFFTLLSLLTTHYCIGSDEKSPPTGGPVLKIDQKEIDLGSIPHDVEEIVGTMVLFNDGNTDLEIRNVSGPCLCFKGYDGDKLIKAGEGGEIFVKFNKSEIPAGSIRRVVYVETNDPAGAKTEVGFNFTIERNPTEEEIRALRSEVAGLRRELRSLSQEMKALTAAFKNSNGTVGVNPKPAAESQIDTTVYDVEVGSSPILGPKDATVTIVEFVDMQCPYCAHEYPTLKEILKQYPGKVRLVFKHFPLGFHTKAKPAHAAVELALQKGGNDAFWKMHDMIMADPKKLEIADLRVYAKKIGMDLDKFDKVTSSVTMMDELLKTDKAMANKCNVKATPSILINGLKLTNRSIEGYKKRINEILAEKAVPKN
jgi:protein-disulfide isomerase